MKFYEVQPALEAGKKITRRSGGYKSISGVHLSKYKNLRDLYSVVFNDGSESVWSISSKDLRADDWEIVDDIRECKLLTHKKYLEEWKAEIEDIMSRENSVDVSMRSIKYQELYLWSIRVGVIDECLEHIKELTKTIK